MADRHVEGEKQETNDVASSPTRTRRLFRAALFFAGSAAFGGLAVALWDRKTLTALRRRDLETPERSAPPQDDIY